jgi:hypothetical protein
MIILAANTAGQHVYMTLQEGRAPLPAFSHYLLVLTYEEHAAGGSPVSILPVIVYENYRVTLLIVSTVGIELPGRYRYQVYGQNSATNTDPDDASVVGVVEQGHLQINDGATYYSSPTLNIPSNVNYNG